MSDRLAHVRWQMGQALLPDHFYAQEESLVAEMHLRNAIRGLPTYGIANMAWSEELLADGVLAITDATIILGTGVLLSVPHNASCPPVNMTLLGTNRVTMYMHFMGDAEEVKELDRGWRSGENQTPKRMHRLLVSTDQAQPEALSSLKLGIFEKQPDGAWALTPDYLPPLIQVGTSPYLKEELERLDSALEAFRGRLTSDALAALSLELMYGSRECLKSLQALRRLLKNTVNHVHPHPYVLLESLISYYVEVCMYRDATPVAANTVYDHDNLAACFESILNPLFEQMTVAVQKTPYLSFNLKDGVYSAQLPTEIRRAGLVYLLVQRSSVTDTFNVNRLKMAAPARLAVVYQRALAGIAFRPVDRPSLGQSFGPEISFFEVGINDEWNAALAEGEVSFYAHPDLAEFSFYLVWR